MCECGCGEMDPWKVVRVGKNVLVIDKYQGCGYCDTGLVVSLHIFTPEEAETHGLAEPERELAPDEHGYGVLHVPVVGPEDLAKAAEEMGLDGGVSGCWDNLADFFRDDEGLELLQRAMGIRSAETERLEEAYKKRMEDK